MEQKFGPIGHVQIPDSNQSIGIIDSLRILIVSSRAQFGKLPDSTHK
jgi:hypothetical protein